MKDAVHLIVHLCLLSSALGLVAPPGAVSLLSPRLPCIHHQSKAPPLVARRRCLHAGDDANAWKLEALSTEVRELKQKIDAAERSIGAIDRKLERMDDANRDIKDSLRTIERATERLVRDNDDRWRESGSLMIPMSFVWAMLVAVGNAAQKMGPM
jgi:outer membrane murein-binding lipoprotein Lpp